MGDILNHILACVAVVALGGVFAGVGIANMKNLFSCRKQIKGVCDTKYTSVNRSHYYLRFCYDYQGKTYRARALDDYDAKHYDFVEGKEYPIYINPRKPHIMRCTEKKVYLRDIILICMGLLIIGGGFFM